jgi:hypothetical protein
LQFAVLLSSSLIDWCLFWTKPSVYSFALVLEGPLEIWSVSFSWILVAGATLLSALHHPFQYGPFMSVAPENWAKVAKNMGPPIELRDG